MVIMKEKKRHGNTRSAPYHHFTSVANQINVKYKTIYWHGVLRIVAWKKNKTMLDIIQDPKCLATDSRASNRIRIETNKLHKATSWEMPYEVAARIRINYRLKNVSMVVGCFKRPLLGLIFDWSFTFFGGGFGEPSDVDRGSGGRFCMGVDTSSIELHLCLRISSSNSNSGFMTLCISMASIHHHNPHRDQHSCVTSRCANQYSS